MLMHESLSKPRHWAVMDEAPGSTMGSSWRPEALRGGVMKVMEASLEYTPWMTVTMLRSYSTQLEMPSLSSTWGLETCGENVSCKR